MINGSSPRLEIGTTLQNRYQIVRFIGRGGMGAVYLCEDLRLPGKQWALKEMILYEPGVAEQVHDSFIREAQFLATLRHRSLPTIVDVFSIKNQQYLVMEYIEGETLAQRIESQGIPSDTVALRWALELAQVLDYLHRQDRPIIFRDLKPENIMINDEGHIKVIDFGLARHFEPGKRRDTQASGTVGYAPPEQWEDSGQSDPRSDIYSLAATLFFVLTGRPPSPIYGSHRIRPYRPDIDPGVEALVLKCLQTDPAQRYRSAAELIKDLLFLLSEDKHQDAITEHRSAIQDDPEPDLQLSPQRPRVDPIATPLSLPKPLASLLGAGLVLFLVGLLLPFVDLKLPTQSKRYQSEDRVAEVLIETEPLKKEAQDLLAQEKYAEAITLLDSIVTRFPRDPEALILKNNAYALLSGRDIHRIPVISSWHGTEREGLELIAGYALAQSNLNKDRLNTLPLIVLDLYDDRSSNETLLGLMSQIVSDESQPMVLGPFTSQQTRLVAPIANSRGLPILAPIASDPRVFSTGPYVFSAADTDFAKIQVLANYLYDNGHRRAAIFIDSSNVISRSWADTFTETFQKRGGTIVIQEEYPSNQADFTEQIQQAHGESADCIFFSEFRVPPLLRFCQDLRASGWEVTLASQTPGFSDSLFREGPETVEGLLLSTFYVPGQGNQEAREFTKEFRQTFDGKLPTHREVTAYDALKLAVDGLDSVGADRQALRDYFDSIGDQRPPYQGVSGRFTLSEALGERTPYILQVENENYVQIDYQPKTD